MTVVVPTVTEVAVAVKQKPELSTLPGVTKAIRAAEGALGTEGRVLVRYSGTEPKARVLVEGPNDTHNRRHAESIADELRKAAG